MLGYCRGLNLAEAFTRGFGLGVTIVAGLIEVVVANIYQMVIVHFLLITIFSLLIELLTLVLFCYTGKEKGSRIWDGLWGGIGLAGAVGCWPQKKEKKGMDVMYLGQGI